MNIAKGQSSKKQHLVKDARTECNLKLSGHAEGMDGFAWWAEKYPETCCKKCLNRFKERVIKKSK